MIPRFGETPLPGQKYIHRRGVYALLPAGRKLLVTCQLEPGPDLQLPGGGIDPGESPVVALHREVLEETGWSIAGPRRVGAFRRFTYMPEYHQWAEKICLIYLARPVRRLGPPGERFHIPLWLDATDAARLMENPGDRHFARRMAATIQGP